MERFTKSVPSEGVVRDSVNIFYVTFVLAANKFNDVLVIYVRMENHVISADDIIVGVLRKNLVCLSKVVLEMKAGLVDWYGVRVIALIEGHQIVAARKALAVDFVEARNVLIELPAKPEQEAGFHI